MSIATRLTALERRLEPVQDATTAAAEAEFLAASPEQQVLWFRDVADLCEDPELRELMEQAAADILAAQDGLREPTRT